MRLWVDVGPGPYGVLFAGADRDLETDEAALEAIAGEWLFPSLDLTWSLSPEALGALAPDTDLDRIAGVFGRAERAFLNVELDGEARLLGLWPNATVAMEGVQAGDEAAADAIGGLVPILVPLAGPFGALVKGAGVLFRAALGSARRRRLVQIAYQRDERGFGWCFARGPKGEGLLDGLHRATAMLAVPRAAAMLAGAALRGRVRAAVDLGSPSGTVFLEHAFAVDLAPYAARPPERPNPKLREARRAEELPMLLRPAEAAAILGLAPAALFHDGRFTPRFAGRFLAFVSGAGADATAVIDRDSFLAFVRAELLR